MANLTESAHTLHNTKFSKEKTEELLKGLKESGAIVGVEDLAQYIRKSGLIVKESIGRKRLVFTVNPKIYGINLAKKRDGIRGFHADHIENGKILFIPKPIERELKNVESSVRMARRRASIGFEERFMTLETYEEFRKDFEEKKTKYFELRDKIVNQWCVLYREFRKALNDWLEEFNAEDREVLYKGILSKIPSVEEYKNSFYMELNIKAFPVAENLDMFKDDIREQIEQGLTDDTVETMYEMIGTTLSQTFEKVLTTIENYHRNGVLAPKTKGSIKQQAETIAKNNIFANPVIAKVKEMLMELIRTEDVTDMGEQILGAIYGYAKELKIDNHIKLYDCYLSEEELLMYYDDFQDEYMTQQPTGDLLQATAE